MNGLKSMGAAVPVLLLLVLGCWLYLLRTLSFWMNKAPVVGHGDARVAQQVNSAIAVLAIWLLLGGLLLLADSNGRMPALVGVASWLLFPISLLMAGAAIAAMYDTKWKLVVTLPVGMPILIAAYVVYLYFPVKGLPTSVAGVAMWTVVILGGLPMIPIGIQFTEKQRGPRSGSVRATPGPELDAFMAREQEKLRQQGLEEIARVDEDTYLSELEKWAGPSSPVRQEALEAMRKLPNHQEQTEKALEYNYSWILPLLPDIGAEPTARLCSAARQYLRNYVAEFRRNNPTPEPFVGTILSEGVEGIGWIAKNCDADVEMEMLEKLALDQQDVPEVRAFRERITAFRKKQDPATNEHE